MTPHHSCTASLCADRSQACRRYDSDRTLVHAYDHMQNGQELTCKTMTAGFELIAVAHPGMLLPKVTLDSDETAVMCVHVDSQQEGGKCLM